LGESREAGKADSELFSILKERMSERRFSETDADDWRIAGDGSCCSADRKVGLAVVFVNADNNDRSGDQGVQKTLDTGT
jgi:hypothetical protein